LVTGREAAALRFTEEALHRAQDSGDATGRALLLQRHGEARITIGDRGGIDEIREAAMVLEHHTHLKTSMAYHNLAESLLGLGELRAAADAHTEAARWAQQFGVAYNIGFSAAGQAEDDYHAGRWSTAVDRCQPLVDHPADQVACFARWVRGRIVLARGENLQCLEDATRILEYATSSENDEARVYGLALSAIAHHARGDAPAVAEAGSRLFELWRHVGAMGSSAYVLAEFTPIAALHDALGEAASVLPDASRWKRALTAIAELRYADAARIYEEIGSKPLEAQAQLLAARHLTQQGRPMEAAAHAEGALGFYRLVDAAAYVRQAEELLRRAESA